MEPSIKFALRCNNILSAYDFQRSDWLIVGSLHASKKPFKIKGLGIPLLIMEKELMYINSSTDDNNKI